MFVCVFLPLIYIQPAEKVALTWYSFTCDAACVTPLGEEGGSGVRAGHRRHLPIHFGSLSFLAAVFRRRRQCEE